MKLTGKSGGVVAAASAIALATTALIGGTTSTAAAASSCTAVQFIGARGSSEPQGLGPTIATTLVEFKARANVSVSSYALVYPASSQPVLNTDATIGAFKSSVDNGTRTLTAYLEAQTKRCPSQRFVIAGYSQGAMVVDRALSDLSPVVLSRVAALAQFGDPLFDPSFIGDQGTFSKDNEGVIKRLLPFYGGSHYVPGPVANRTQSYCINRDPVCNYSLGNVVSCFARSGDSQCPHQRYIANGYTGKAGWYLASKIK